MTIVIRSLIRHNHRRQRIKVNLTRPLSPLKNHRRTRRTRIPNPLLLRRISHHSQTITNYRRQVSSSRRPILRLTQRLTMVLRQLRHLKITMRPSRTSTHNQSRFRGPIRRPIPNPRSQSRHRLLTLRHKNLRKTRQHLSPRNNRFRLAHSLMNRRRTSLTRRATGTYNQHNLITRRHRLILSRQVASSNRV